MQLPTYLYYPIRPDRSTWIWFHGAANCQITRAVIPAVTKEVEICPGGFSYCLILSGVDLGLGRVNARVAVTLTSMHSLAVS